MANARRHIVASIGEIVWDCFPDGTRLGGCAANVVCHAAHLGVEAVLVSAVGSDRWGEAFRTAWRQRGLSLNSITTISGHPTATVSITVDHQGQPRFDFPGIAAHDFIPWTSEIRMLAAHVEAVFFGTFAQWKPMSRQTIQSFVAQTQLETLRMFDINLRKDRYTRETIAHSLHLATALKLNEGELFTLSQIFQLRGDVRSRLQFLLDQYALRLIALTRGERGSVICTANGDWEEHPGYPVTAVDTVGAGDAFTAALVVGLLEKRPLAEVSDRANRTASFVCTQPGATPRLPDMFKNNWGSPDGSTPVFAQGPARPM